MHQLHITHVKCSPTDEQMPIAKGELHQHLAYGKISEDLQLLPDCFRANLRHVLKRALMVFQHRNLVGRGFRHALTDSRKATRNLHFLKPKKAKLANIDQTNIDKFFHVLVQS